MRACASASFSAQKRLSPSAAAKTSQYYAYVDGRAVAAVPMIILYGMSMCERARALRVDHIYKVSRARARGTRVRSQ